MLLEVGEESGVWSGEERDEGNEASSVGDVDGVLCTKRDGALPVAVEIVVGVEGAIEACAREGWEERDEADFCCLGRVRK